MTMESGPMLVFNTLSEFTWPGANISLTAFPMAVQTWAAPSEVDEKLASLTYLKATNAIAEPPFATTTGGLIGLGRGRSTIERVPGGFGLSGNQPLIESIDNFTLFLTDGEKRNASFLALNEPLDEVLSSSGFYSTPMDVLLWNVQSPGINEANSDISYTVNIEAVRLNNDDPLQPHAYRGETAEIASVGIISANSRGIEVLYEVFNYVQKHFLGSLEWCNSVGGIEDPALWTCDAQLLPHLPRVAIYIDNMVWCLSSIRKTIPTTTRRTAVGS